MAVEQVGTRSVAISDLTFFPGNPRRGNLAEIRKSVARLGQYRSVVVRDTGSELVILAGNHTVQAMAAEGFEAVSCTSPRPDHVPRTHGMPNEVSHAPTPLR